MTRLPFPPLLLITDRHQANLPLETIAQSAFAAGCRWLSLREKDLPPTDRLALLHRLAAIAADWHALIGIHDDLAAAAAIPGIALHLPANASAIAARKLLGPNRLIGQSAHAGNQLLAPNIEALDYITLSPVFASASKPGYGPALGIEGLAAAIRQATIPVIALGGIQPPTVSACLNAGAAGIAIMGEPMRAADTAETIRCFLRELPLSAH